MLKTVRRILTLICAVTCCTAILAGCAAGNEPDVTNADDALASQAPVQADATPDQAGVQDAEHITEYVSEVLTIDADISGSPKAEAGVVQAEFIRPDAATVRQVLFEGEETETEDLSDGSAVLISGGDSRAVLEYGTRSSSLWYRSEYSNSVFDVVQYRPDDAVNGLEPYEGHESVPFAAPSEIKAEFIEVLDKLGVSNVCDVSIYALDHETLSKEKDLLQAEQERNSTGSSKTNRDFKDVWTEVDDCYFLTAECDIDGIAVNTQDTIGPSDEYAISGTVATALYNADGLQALSVDNFMQADSIGEPETIINAKEALEAVSDKYRDLIVDSVSTIASAGLIYSPLPSGQGLTLNPVWQVAIDQQYPDVEIDGELVHNSPRRIYEYIDAFTGQEFMSAAAEWN